MVMSIIAVYIVVSLHKEYKLKEEIAVLKKEIELLEKSNKH